MIHVQQGDEWGCGIAVLAMLTGQSYADVDAAFPYRLGREDERDKCVKPVEMMAYLWDQGYELRVIRDRRYAINGYNGIWPSLVPFAPRHYAMVDSPTQPTGHWIALDGNARVFDPFSHLRDTLGHYAKMHEVVGVWPPLAASASQSVQPTDDEIEQAAKGACYSAFCAGVSPATKWADWWGENKTEVVALLTVAQKVYERLLAEHEADPARAKTKAPVFTLAVERAEAAEAEVESVKRAAERQAATLAAETSAALAARDVVEARATEWNDRCEKRTDELNRAKVERDAAVRERDEAIDLIEQIYDIGMGESSVAVENLLIARGRLEL